MTRVTAALRPFRLAHLSDLHIGPLPPLAPRDLLSKRLLGYLSWRARKQRIHRIEVLAALERDLQASAPDHVVITGDLVNLAPAGRVRPGRRLAAGPGRTRVDLGGSGQPRLLSADRRERVLDALGRLHGLRRGRHANEGGWRPASPICGAAGRLRSSGSRARSRRRRALRPAGLARRSSRRSIGCSRTCLATTAAGWCCCITRRRLAQAGGASVSSMRQPSARIVARRGADLILHGHEHTPVSGLIESRQGAIPVLGVPVGFEPRRPPGAPSPVSDLRDREERIGLGGAPARRTATIAPARASWRSPRSRWRRPAARARGHAEDRPDQQP